MSPALRQWAGMWGLPIAALDDLAARLAVEYADHLNALDGASEAAAQAHVRVEGVSRGLMLFRNNVGALKDDRGRMVRYGLANDTPALNKSLKSGDLIGWRRVLITHDMVGQKLAQFVSVEVKRPGWRFAGTDRERAQQAWVNLVAANGGHAFFSTGGFAE